MDKSVYSDNLIKTLKRNLLLAIIRKPIEKITDSEANIAYELARDGDVQELLENEKPPELPESKEEKKE